MWVGSLEIARGGVGVGRKGREGEEGRAGIRWWSERRKGWRG